MRVHVGEGEGEGGGDGVHKNRLLFCRRRLIVETAGERTCFSTAALQTREMYSSHYGRGLLCCWMRNKLK